jgi:hypothetical protein
VFIGFGDAAKAGYGMAITDVSGESQILNRSMELITQLGDTLMLKEEDTVLLSKEVGRCTRSTAIGWGSTPQIIERWRIMSCSLKRRFEQGKFHKAGGFSVYG